MADPAFEVGKAARKILIIGSVGAGKTTLARRLCRKTGIPHYELDCVAHEGEGKSRRKRTPQEQMEVLRQVDLTGAWIFEGTLRESYAEILAWAESIVFLDPPLPLRKALIFLRFIKQCLGLEQCHYKSDIKMLCLMYKWTREFEASRPAFEARLKASGGQVVYLKYKSEYSINEMC
ncbi:MAG TPA: hypothetical protein PKB13_03010 [Clostridia bacterium]|nr:hypothetical protein [Clostridia bacterium]